MLKDLREVAVDVRIVFFGKAFRQVVTFLSTIAFTRFLGAKAFGRFVYIYTFIEILAMATRLGFRKGLVAFLPRYSETNNIDRRAGYITFSLVLTGIFSLVVSIFLIGSNNFAARVLLNQQDLSKLVSYSAFLVFGLTLLEVNRGVFQGLRKIGIMVLSEEVIGPSVRLLLFFCFYFLFPNEFSLLIATYVGIATALAIFLGDLSRTGHLKVFLTREYVRDYRHLVSFSLPLLFSGFAAFLMSRLDIYMIGFFLTAKDVAYYRVATRIGTASVIVLAAFDIAFAPLVSKLFNSKDIVKISVLYRSLTRLILLINSAIFVIIAAQSEHILLIFGQQFRAAAIPLVLIAAGQLVNAATGSAGSINIMTGKPHYEFWSALVSVSLNVILNLIMIPRLGILGAALAFMTSLSIQNVSRLVLMFRHLRIHPFDISYLKVIICSGGAYLAAVAYKSLFDESWWLELIVTIFIILVFVIVSYFFVRLSKEDLELLKSLVRPFNKKSVGR